MVPNGITTGAGDGSIVGDKSPTTHLKLDKTVTGYSGFGGDASWSSWLGAQDASKVLWTVAASDSQSTSASNLSRMIITGDIGTTVRVSNGQVTNGVAANKSLSGAGFGTFTTSNTGSNLGTTFTNDWGLSPSGVTTNTLDHDSFLYYITRTVATGSSALSANIVQFASDPKKQARVHLSSNGDFSYTMPAQISAVPLPGGVWLMGAGLMVVMGKVRRRKTTLGAA